MPPFPLPWLPLCMLAAAVVWSFIAGYGRREIDADELWLGDFPNIPNDDQPRAGGLGAGLVRNVRDLPDGHRSRHRSVRDSR